MIKPAKIIDSHIHLITAETHRLKLERMSKLASVQVEAYHRRWQESLTARNEDGPEESPPDVTVVAERWEADLERAGIERAVFFASDEVHAETVRFVRLKPDRFIGYTTFDPTEPGSAGLLGKLVEEEGIKGIKLYPMKRHFHVNDPACFPVYEVCRERQIPVLIHFGLSISATHDLSYGHPLDLSTLALRFPSVKWIIPHFGTGFFRELLLLAAQYRNVYIDTSSSNAWIRHSPYPLTLHDLFKRSYETVGSKRILFGTDSSFFPRGFRTNILGEQLKVCNEIGLDQNAIDDIFYNNIKEILRLT